MYRAALISGSILVFSLIPTSAFALDCLSGTHSKTEDSTVVCVSEAQAQAQSQSQTQNNNQNVNVSNSISGGYAPQPLVAQPQNRVVLAAAPQPSSTPQVIALAPVQAKELPKTGLPIAAMSLAGLLPLGLKIRSIGRKTTEFKPNSIWEEKQFKN